MTTPTRGTAPVVLFLPARDEADAVAEVIARIPAEVCGHPVRCVVVDDGSADATASVAAGAGAEVVAHEVGLGLGAAVRTGFAAALDRGAAAVAFCDADGEYDPAELDRLVAPILAGEADYVVGSRFAGLPRRMLPHRWAGNRALTWWVRGIARRRFGLRGLSDGQSGYRALSAEAAAAAEVIHDFNYAQVLTFDLLAKGCRYREVPITYRFRTTGRSFVKLLPYLRQVVPAVRAELRGASEDAAIPAFLTDASHLA
jgi:glycosyltransferase involved in cell wall biosynthesis